MSRRFFMFVVAAAVLLVSAIAVFCISEDGFSEASGDPAFMPGEFNDGFRELQGPSPQGPEMPIDRDFGPRGPTEPKRYVIDAPDRQDVRPERIIDDYGRMYEEKRHLEEQGAEVFVYDPELERDGGRELADVINRVFDGAVVPEKPRNAETVEPAELPESYDVSFLEYMLEETGEDSWLGQLLSVMISQYVSNSSESEGVAPSTGREEYVLDVPSDAIREEEEEKESELFVDDLPEYVPSSVSYLTEHGFDGGTLF